MTDNSLPQRYVASLDGLRGVAILAVLVEHFIPVGAIVSLSPGGAGVTLFFVLSGYLITRILLAYDRNQVSVKAAATHFYWRRFLRLSPPYYAAIGIALALGLAAMRRDWWIHSLYLTNVRIGLSGQWSGSATHFWSLATEEQFYLVWFVVVVMLPRRYLPSAIWGSFAITAAFRAGAFALGYPPLVTVLLPGNLVSLAMGALLAYSECWSAVPWVDRIVSSRIALLLLACAFAATSLSLPFIDWPRALLYPFIGAALFACVVRMCADETRNLFVRAMEWPRLVQIGKISYGIFVYHIFVAYILDGQLPSSWRESAGGWLRFAVLVLISLSLAQASWILLERRILARKDVVRIDAAGIHWRAGRSVETSLDRGLQPGSAVAD